MEEKIRISGMVSESIVDGVGLRFTVFTQGCPHHCPGCHNPHTHPFEGGTFLSAEEIFKKIQKSPLCSGVTLSGGEPFSQAGALLPLARMVKSAGLHLCGYSGYTLEELVERGKQNAAVRALLEELDVLVDGPFLLEERTLDKRFVGSRNQRCLDVRRSLENDAPVLAENWQ